MLEARASFLIRSSMDGGWRRGITCGDAPNETRTRCRERHSGGGSWTSSGGGVRGGLYGRREFGEGGTGATRTGTALTANTIETASTGGTTVLGSVRRGISGGVGGSVRGGVFRRAGGRCGGEGSGQQTWADDCGWGGRGWSGFGWCKGRTQSGWLWLLCLD